MQIMIRRFEAKDLDGVMRIWLGANVEAHGFVGRGYWEGMAEVVRGLIPQAEVYVCEREGRVVGFVGLTGEWVAGVFVAPGEQGQGIGRVLMERAKGVREGLRLGVYKRNVRAVRFYEREGFVVAEEGVDVETGEEEWVMCWGRVVGR